MGKLLRTLGFCAALAGVFTALGAGPGAYPAAVNRFEDQAGIFPKEQTAPWRDALVERLAAFETQTGIRVVVQFHAKSPPEVEDKVPGAYMSALSTRLGLIEHGILVVYFADDPDWRIWFGNQVAPAFVGKPGTAASLTADGSIHAAKEAFIAACQAQAAERLKAASLPKDIARVRPIAEGLAICEGLTKRLGGKP